MKKSIKFLLLTTLIGWSGLSMANCDFDAPSSPVVSGEYATVNWHGIDGSCFNGASWVIPDVASYGNWSSVQVELECSDDGEGAELRIGQSVTDIEALIEDSDGGDDDITFTVYPGVSGGLYVSYEPEDGACDYIQLNIKARYFLPTDTIPPEPSREEQCEDILDEDDGDEFFCCVGDHDEIDDYECQALGFRTLEQILSDLEDEED